MSCNTALIRNYWSGTGTVICRISTKPDPIFRLCRKLSSNVSKSHKIFWRKDMLLLDFYIFLKIYLLPGIKFFLLFFFKVFTLLLKGRIWTCVCKIFLPDPNQIILWSAALQLLTGKTSVTGLVLFDRYRYGSRFN